MMWSSNDQDDAYDNRNKAVEQADERYGNCRSPCIFAFAFIGWETWFAREEDEKEEEAEHISKRISRKEQDKLT